MPQLSVIARNTALAYRDRAVDLRDIAKELGVRYIVDGAIQIEGERVRVLAHLVDAGDNRQIWAHRYETEMTGLFVLQDKIVLEVVTGLQVEMTEGEQVRVSLVHGTTNLQAWLTAGEALHHIRRLTRIDNARARALYERAVELDPSYPGAWDGLAWTHFIDARFGWTASIAESLRQAASLAARTLALDPERPGTYALLGGIALAQGRHAEAVSLAERAVALSPNGADVAAILGLILTYAGEAERAAQLLQRAMRLSPRHPDWYRWALGRAYRLMGDGEKAIATLASHNDAESESIAPLIELAASYMQAGKIASAHTLAQRALSHDPAFSARAWTALPPYRDAAVAAQERALLVSAGLPE
jgi:adenylate cyclase